MKPCIVHYYYYRKHLICLREKCFLKKLNFVEMKFKIIETKTTISSKSPSHNKSSSTRLKAFNFAYE